ncbi:hypothetical protein GOODEAATRI_031695, partial [Goodea atripinnis]
RVKLQFELNDTLQIVDVLRGELTEVGNRLETIEGSQATPPSLEEWGGEQKPTSQVETNHVRPIGKPDGKGWNRQAEGIMGKEMEDALRKMVTEAVCQVTTPPTTLETGSRPSS